jgi:anthranilate synthase component I
LETNEDFLILCHSGGGMLTNSILKTISAADTARIPVVRELSADLETPVSVYLKLTGPEPSFLLESVTGGENLARYSFIGVNPQRVYLLRGRSLEIHSAGERSTIELAANTDPLDSLRAELQHCGWASAPGLPRFTGGLVGYLGYEMARFFEPSVGLEAHSNLPDAIFLLADTLVAFDHAFGKMILIANILPGETGTVQAEARLDDLQRRLAAPLPAQPPQTAAPAAPLRSNRSREQFTAAVRRAKEHIAAGDIFQLVFSQRLERETSAKPFDIYRALRRLNPSPYMFFFDFAHLAGGEALRVIGASPEMHVRLEGRRAIIRPIAGTLPRGTTPAEDSAQESRLLADPKERAEHVMLVDLARNDLGRVCEYGSVHVPELMTVERYSHVMHIVSQAEGQLRPEFDAFDLLRATFPAGTVSGAPKIRAMQIIRDLELDPRGPYAGAAGYFAADGTMDTCITIRTLVMRGRTVSVQAGAGIVADSDPDREYEESLNKARALAVAVEMAEKPAAAPLEEQ